MRDWDVAAQALREAPLAVEGWDVALRAMAHATGSTFGQLIALGPQGARVANHISDMPADLLAAFEQAPASYSEENWRIASTAAPLHVVTEDDYDRARLDCETDWYDEACDRLSIPLGMQTVLCAGGRSMVGIAALRTNRDGRSGAEERGAFASLLPHALSGVRLQMALAGQAVAATVDGFTASRQAIFVLDRAGMVRGSSEAAQDALRERLLCLRDGRLGAVHPADDRELASVTAAVLAAADAGRPARRVIWLGKHGGHHQARRCELLPLPRRASDYLGHWPRILVRLLDPPPQEERAQDLLIELMHLTPAEADVALMIMQGVPREEIALRRRTSAGTVAIQLKRVFEKADVRREAELVALLHRLLG